jgi:hypothetical protein
MASVVIVVQVDDEAEAVTTLVLRGAVIRRAPGLDELVCLLERLQLGVA